MKTGTNKKKEPELIDRIEIKIYKEGLKNKFKNLCKVNNTSMTEVLEKSIRKYIQEKG